MKIVIPTPIFPPEIGGPATYVSELAKRLSAEHEITIITFTQDPQPTKNTKVIPISQHKHFLGILFRQLKLAAAIFKYAKNADMIYSQGPIVVGFTSAVVGKILVRSTIIKFVGDEVWETARLEGRTRKDLESFYNSSLDFADEIRARLQRLSLHLCDAIITPPKYLEEVLLKVHGVRKPIHVIPNAIELKPPKISKKKFQLIYVGRLVPWKNIDDIIKSVNLARKKIPWKLVIVGDGPEKQHIKQLVEKLDANSWVTLVGKYAKTKALEEIARSEKLILYSNYEGMSHTLIETMLLKTSIIASDIQANQETLNGFGTLVPLKDVPALAKAINSRGINVDKAYTFAKRKYSWEGHIKKLEKLL